MHTKALPSTCVSKVTSHSMLFVTTLEPLKCGHHRDHHCVSRIWRHPCFGGFWYISCRRFNVHLCCWIVQATFQSCAFARKPYQRLCMCTSATITPVVGSSSGGRHSYLRCMQVSPLSSEFWCLVWVLLRLKNLSALQNSKVSTFQASYLLIGMLSIPEQNVH